MASGAIWAQQLTSRLFAIRAGGWWQAAVAVLVASLGFAVTHPSAASAEINPVGAHSMLQLNDPPSFMQAMFAEAATMHASAIRLDVAPALIFAGPSRPPDFSGLDDVMSLSQRDGIPVVADLMTIPSWIADCQTAAGNTNMSRCGTDDLSKYGSMISQIVSHADPIIRDWEVWNEPDGGGFFTGTPQQYARMLRSADDAIKAVDPEDDVLLGGISGTSGVGWLGQVFATPGADAVHAFDTANVHIRGSLDSLAGDTRLWRWFFAANGFTGPLWVTEHGYPSDASYQYDPAYASGAGSQAAYLSASIPTLIDSGASRVFVTERDNLGGQFASEGVLGGDVLDPPPADPAIVVKPAFSAVQALGDCYVSLGRDCPGPVPASTPASVTIPATAPGGFITSVLSVSDPAPGPLQLGKVALGAPASGPLTIQADTCSNTLLEPDQSCTVTIGFAPTTGGAADSTVNIPSNNGSDVVAVAAVAPSVSSLTSPQLSDPRFTPVDRADGVGHDQRLVLALSNPLSTSVFVAGASLAGPQADRFRIQSDGCVGANVAPGGSCDVAVLFDAIHPGTAHSVLALSGDGTPLSVALSATASALPAIVALTATRRYPCFDRSSPNRVLVLTSEPTSISWRATRRRLHGDPLCRRPSGAPRTADNGRRSSASGRATTGVRPMNIRARKEYALRLALPVGPARRALRPGLYRLTLSPHNEHGTGRARTMMVTVLP